MKCARCIAQGKTDRQALYEQTTLPELRVMKRTCGEMDEQILLCPDCERELKEFIFGKKKK